MRKTMRRIIGGILAVAITIAGSISPLISTGEGAARRFGTDPGARIAEVFNTDKATFMQDVKSGKSLEEIAVLHGVDPQEAKTAITERLTNAMRLANSMGSRRAGIAGIMGKRRGGAGTAEKLTAAEVELLQNNLPVYIDNAFAKPGLLNVTEKMKRVLGAGAEVLGMSQDEMLQQLGNGTTVQALAETQGVPLTNVTAGMSGEIARQADELVADGILPEFIAERLKTNMDSRINNMLQSGYSQKWMDDNQQLWTTMLR